MLAKSVFTLLCALVCILFYVIGFWRRKAGEAAFAAARAATDEKERERYCQLSVLAGNRNACRMFCFSHPDIYESRQPLKPYSFRGMQVTFYGYYYPTRHEKLLSSRQRMFCHALFRFKDGEIHGVRFFKSCMEALHLEEENLHVMFMPCSSREKYIRRFSRLDEYISTHCPQMISGLNDVVVTGTRESLHKIKGGKKRILKRNYSITGDIEGKDIVIVDDVMTTGQSVSEYKKEIERCGGRVTAAIFYGKTVEVPPLFILRMHVWYIQAKNLLRETGKKRKRWNGRGSM